MGSRTCSLSGLQIPGRPGHGPSELDASIRAGCWGDSSEQVRVGPLDKRGDRRRRASHGGQALGAAESDRETGLCWAQARPLDVVTG